MPSSEGRQPGPAVEAATSEPEEQVLDLARKLVGLAKEQRRALEIGAREQFSWAALRRGEVTDRLSRLLAAQAPVSEGEGAELERLRSEMLVVDDAMQQLMKLQLKDLATRQRVFIRRRKALGSYLSTGPRRGFFDQQR